MNDSFYVVLELAIQPGQSDNFRALVKDLIASASKESGTLSYQWNLSADQTRCHVYERYQDSASFMAHADAFGPFVERFNQAVRPVRLDVYGSPNDAAKAALADFRPVYYTPIGGFNR